MTDLRAELVEKLAGPLCERVTSPDTWYLLLTRPARLNKEIQDKGPRTGTGPLTPTTRESAYANIDSAVHNIWTRFQHEFRMVYEPSTFLLIYTEWQEGVEKLVMETLKKTPVTGTDILEIRKAIVKFYVQQMIVVYIRFTNIVVPENLQITDFDKLRTALAKLLEDPKNKALDWYHVQLRLIQEYWEAVYRGEKTRDVEGQLGSSTLEGAPAPLPPKEVQRRVEEYLDGEKGGPGGGPQEGPPKSPCAERVRELEGELLRSLEEIRRLREMLEKKPKNAVDVGEGGLQKNGPSPTAPLRRSPQGGQLSLVESFSPKRAPLRRRSAIADQAPSQFSDQPPVVDQNFDELRVVARSSDQSPKRNTDQFSDQPQDRDIGDSPDFRDEELMNRLREDLDNNPVDEVGKEQILKKMGFDIICHARGPHAREFERLYEEGKNEGREWPRRIRNMHKIIRSQLKKYPWTGTVPCPLPLVLEMEAPLSLTPSSSRRGSYLEEKNMPSVSEHVHRKGEKSTGGESKNAGREYAPLNPGDQPFLKEGRGGLEVNKKPPGPKKVLSPKGVPGGGVWGWIKGMMGGGQEASKEASSLPADESGERNPPPPQDRRRQGAWERMIRALEGAAEFLHKPEGDHWLAAWARSANSGEGVPRVQLEDVSEYWYSNAIPVLNGDRIDMVEPGEPNLPENKDLINFIVGLFLHFVETRPTLAELNYYFREMEYYAYSAHFYVLNEGFDVYSTRERLRSLLERVYEVALEYYEGLPEAELAEDVSPPEPGEEPVVNVPDDFFQVRFPEDMFSHVMGPRQRRPMENLAPLALRVLQGLPGADKDALLQTQAGILAEFENWVKEMTENDLINFDVLSRRFFNEIMRNEYVLRTNYPHVQSNFTTKCLLLQIRAREKRDQILEQRPDLDEPPAEDLEQGEMEEKEFTDDDIDRLLKEADECIKVTQDIIREAGHDQIPPSPALLALPGPGPRQMLQVVARMTPGPGLARQPGPGFVRAMVGEFMAWTRGVEMLRGGPNRDLQVQVAQRFELFGRMQSALVNYVPVLNIRARVYQESLNTGMAQLADPTQVPLMLNYLRVYELAFSPRGGLGQLDEEDLITLFCTRTDIDQVFDQQEPELHALAKVNTVTRRGFFEIFKDRKKLARSVKLMAGAGTSLAAATGLALQVYNYMYAQVATPTPDIPPPSPEAMEQVGEIFGLAASGVYTAMQTLGAAAFAYGVQSAGGGEGDGRVDIQEMEQGEIGYENDPGRVGQNEMKSIDQANVVGDPIRRQTRRQTFLNGLNPPDPLNSDGAPLSKPDVERCHKGGHTRYETQGGFPDGGEGKTLNLHKWE